MPAKKRFGVKRRKETIVSPSPLKRSRFSARKDQTSTAERQVSLPSRMTEAQSNPTAKTSIRQSSDDGKAPRDGQCRQRCDSGKENAPLTGTESPKGSPAALPLPIPTVAPALPAMECPTLFSARMYKRLYGKDHINSTSPVPRDLMEFNEMAPPAIVNEEQKLSSPAPNILGSSPGSDETEDSRTQSPILVLKPFVTSFSTTPKCHDAQPEVTSVVPKTVPELLPEKVEPPLIVEAVTNVVPNPVPELPPEKLEPTLIVEAVTNVVPKSVPALLPEKLAPPLSVEAGRGVPGKTDSCDQGTGEGSNGKSRISGLLTVCKPRIQSPAVRPMQHSAVLDTPAKVSEEKCSLEADTPVTAPGSKKLADKKPTPDRHLKVPSLPGSVKGRTVRKVFAPISNQWNCSSTPINEPSDGNRNYKKDCDEVLSVKTVSRTSELTVRVDDSRVDGLKKQSLVEDVFGSPVKWADDSSDSPVSEGVANSRKTIIYSVFGSPLKSLDSNSSDHPFTVPPGAYEDSCWTNQTLDKIPSKTSDVSSRVSKSLEPVENKPAETSHEPVADKITKTSICPPPLQSVIKKNKSMFSPLKDSRLSVPNDEPSRSNTGIFFPFPRPKYEDSVLGQFDDTAQFVSALAKVDTKISPLSTPVKSDENNTQLHSVIVKNPPTSFKEVFRKNVQNEEAADLGHIGPKTAENGVQPGSVSNEQFECGNSQAIARPKITVTPPKSDNIKIIHRPNFASSTIFEVKSGVKSWFPNAPARMVTPRKAPRLVSNVNRSNSPKGIDMSVSARVAINDAFVIEQEERVRRWELDHLFENTIRSASGSPVKILNRSPTRKRIESPGNSPLKRSRKQPSPNKSPRRVEFRKNLGIATSQPVPNLNVPDGSLVNVNTTAVPGKQIDVAKSVDPCQNPPIKFLPDTTPKLTDMVSAIMSQIKLGIVGTTELKSNDTAPKSDAANVDKMVENAEKTPCFDIKTLVKSIAVTELEYCEPPGGGDMRPKIAIPDRIPSEATPVAAQNIQPDALPVERTDDNLKIQISENAATVLPSGHSDEPSSLPMPNAATRPSNIVKTGKPEIQSIALKNKRPLETKPTVLNPTEPPPSVVEGTEHVDASVKKSFSSKYDSIILRVRPSTPLNKSVAARVRSSGSTGVGLMRAGVTITTPVQSSKNANFKRSSALKPASQKIQNPHGSSPLTVQSPPSSSKSKDSENPKSSQPVPDRIQPLEKHGRSTPKLDVCTTGDVQSVSHDHREEDIEVMIEHQAPATESPKVGPDRWKIHEIDRQRVDKPFSLLQKFMESNGIPVVHPARDPNAVMRSEPSNAKTTKESDAALLTDGDEVVKIGSDFAPAVCSTPKCPGKGTRPEAALQNGRGNYPPKSSSRKTILLDPPIKMESPIKGRMRSGESIQPTKRKCDSIAGAPLVPDVLECGRDRTETLEKSSRMAKKTRVSPGRQAEELPSNNLVCHRSESRSRPSRNASPKSRESRPTSRDEHLKSERRKSRSSHRPERSPGRKSIDRERRSHQRNKSRPRAASPVSTKERHRPESGGKTSGESVSHPSKSGVRITELGSSASVKTQSKTFQTADNSSARSNTGPLPGSAISPTTQLAAPPGIIPLNRRPANFSAPCPVVPRGKRPAMFSASAPPVKILNRSPTRKRIESPGKAR